VNVISWNT
jgi:ribosome assembly protein RRB1